MIKKISPSMMCAPLFELKNTIRTFEKCGVEYLHIDIMDGDFVPNFTLGTDYIRMLKAETDIPLDIHLMITEPERKLGWFEFGQNDYVSVHAEATAHLHRTVSYIKERGAKAMAAINPATPLCNIKTVLDDIDAVLIMTVNPGYAGQALVPSTLKKIKDLRDYLDQNGYPHIEIEVDGNVNFRNAELMSDAGANIFVAGSSSVFQKGSTVEENIKKLRESVN